MKSVLLLEWLRELEKIALIDKPLIRAAIERIEHLESAVPESGDIIVRDLSMLVRRLCRAMELSENQILIAAAAPARDYLKRKGLEGSILRDSGPDSPSKEK